MKSAGEMAGFLQHHNKLACASPEGRRAWEVCYGSKSSGTAAPASSKSKGNRRTICPAASPKSETRLAKLFRESQLNKQRDGMAILVRRLVG